MATISGAIIQAAGFRPGASGILFQSDNAADIGAAAANRPRDLHLGRNAAVGGTLAVTGATTLTGAVTLASALSGVSAVLDQAAADSEILTLRSSDVAHGMTSVTDTTTFGAASKYSAAEGGLYLRGFAEGLNGVVIGSNVVSTYSSRTTGGTAAIVLDARLKTGTTETGMGSDVNLLAVGTNNVMRFFLDSDGDSHQDVGTAWTNFDTHDDVALLNHFAAKVTRRDDPLRKGFGKWLRRNREELARVRLVTFNRDGHHFVNMSRLTMLHTGAIRQTGAAVQATRERVEALEDALRHLLIGNPDRALRLLPAAT